MTIDSFSTHRQKVVIIHKDPIEINIQSIRALIRGRTPTPLISAMESPVPIKNKVSVRLFLAMGTSQFDNIDNEGTKVFNSIAPIKKRIKYGNWIFLSLALNINEMIKVSGKIQRARPSLTLVATDNAEEP